MLTLTKIQQLDASRYLVSIDRNEIVRTYVFTTQPPVDGVVPVTPPAAFLIDMADYASSEQLHDATGPKPPVLKIPCELVRQLALGEEVSLPVILDER